VPNPKGPILHQELFPGSELDAEQLEFIRAIEQFKKRYQRRYPTWSEILLVLKSLGYTRVSKASSPSPEQQVPDAETADNLAQATAPRTDS
jgi:hypothetical protein